jgi:predicted permease
MFGTLRSLAKSPLFTIAAIATLALGIGANTAVFSVLHSVVLAPLPFPSEERLVTLPSHNTALGITNGGVSADDLREWREQNHHFSAVAGHRYYYFNLTKITPPLQVSAAKTTDDFFKIMAVPPLLGRTWEPRDFQPDAAPVVILGHPLWANSYGADRAIIGRTIFVDDRPMEIVGVMPAGFRDVFGVTDMWVPEPLEGPAATPGGGRWWAGIAILKPGADLAHARAEIQALAAAQAQARPERNANWTAQVVPARRALVEGVDTGLALLGGAGACLLLITCANVGGLVIARAQSRRREVAIRSALGATRLDLFRQFLAEGLVLGLAGGVLGALLAWLGVPALVQLLPTWFPRADEISVNATTLTVTALISAFTGIVFGLLPVLGGRRDREPGRDLQSRGSDSPGVGRARAGLMIAEVALSVILLTGAGLMVRSFFQIQNVPSGIQPRGLSGMVLYPLEMSYPDRAARKLFFDSVMERVRAVPGVESASLTRTTPFMWGIRSPFEVEGRPAAPGQTPSAYLDPIDSDFFRTMGIPLRAGRSFAATDQAESPLVLVINESMARKYFSDRNPIGQVLRLTDYPDQPTAEIVGVAADVRRSGLLEATPIQMYASYQQLAPPFATIMFRSTAADPNSLVKSVHRAIWAVNSDQPIGPTLEMEQLIANSVGIPRLGLVLFAVFAGVALLLAAVGLYGVIAYSVGTRTREFGIRMALGAESRQIFGLVLREGGILVAVGLALGLIASLALARLMTGLVFGISPTDPLSFLLVIPLLGFVALLAAALPARRATRIDPNSALRAE